MTDPTDPYEISFPDMDPYTGPLADAPLPLKVFKVQVFLGAVLRESADALSASALLPAVLANLAAVDYMAGFHCGHQTQRQDYIAFLEEFFPDAYVPHAPRIYRDLRCGLMHNLVVSNPWQAPAASPFLLTRKRGVHLEEVGDRLVFSVGEFVLDVQMAWRKLSHGVIMLRDTEPERRERFEKRFGRLAGAGAFMEDRPDADGAAEQGHEAVKANES